MSRPTQAQSSTVEAIAAFALRADDGMLSDAARDRLKRSLLDGIGCAIAAIGAGPVRAIREAVDAFGGRPLCTLIGGGHSAPDRAALYNGCLVRYLEFMDNVARRGEVCHPIDNFAPLLAAAEHQGSSGRDLLMALAVSYQVQARLLALPTMRAGLNCTMPLAFSVAAGVSRLLGLDAARTGHALALAGVGAVSLACIQAEPVSQWKGLSSGEAASRALHNTYLAAWGITGPPGVFDGPHGLFALLDASLPLDWSREGLDAPLETSLKKHNAEFQSQTAIDLAIALREEHALDAGTVRRVAVTVTDGAYQVLGGGSYGPKDVCRSKEQADHNLKYLIAVALIDGVVGPAQFAPDRIAGADVQALLQKVEVVPSEAYTARIPGEMPAAITIEREDDDPVSGEATAYDGFHTRPMIWDAVREKFHRLTEGRLSGSLGEEICLCVDHLEAFSTRHLVLLLSRAGAGPGPD